MKKWKISRFYIVLEKMCVNLLKTETLWRTIQKLSRCCEFRTFEFGENRKTYVKTKQVFFLSSKITKSPENKTKWTNIKMMYRPNFYESTCLRCNEIVYQVDRVGPLKDFTFFHSGCFKCVSCGTKLTLKTYYNNQHKQEDKEVMPVLTNI